MIEKVIADFESISIYRCNWSRLRSIHSVQDLRFFKLIMRPTFAAFISRCLKNLAWSIVSQLIVMPSSYMIAPI